LGADVVAKWQYLTGDPQKFNNQQVRDQLKSMVTGLKKIDNDIINKNGGLVATKYPELIQRHPDWWQKTINAANAAPNPVMQPGGSPAPAVAHPQASAAEQWANAHPDDPRAKQILQRLGK
jgi:hypothetical protein